MRPAGVGWKAAGRAARGRLAGSGRPAACTLHLPPAGLGAGWRKYGHAHLMTCRLPDLQVAVATSGPGQVCPDFAPTQGSEERGGRQRRQSMWCLPGRSAHDTMRCAARKRTRRRRRRHRWWPRAGQLHCTKAPPFATAAPPSPPGLFLFHTLWLKRKGPPFNTSTTPDRDLWQICQHISTLHSQTEPDGRCGYQDALPPVTLTLTLLLLKHPVTFCGGHAGVDLPPLPNLTKASEGLGERTYEGYDCVERSMAEGIKQQAGRCHARHAIAHGPEPPHTNPIPPAMT
eukprot:365984-Chlamydomonas_euryale.AAC.6